jgi:hypothetical protein
MATMGQHGDGTITARRDGRLQVAVTMLDRRREFAYVPKSLVRRDPKAAARMAERLRDELLERRDAELEPGRQTLTAYLRSWLTSLEQAKRRKVRPRTLEHYRLIVEAHIIPALGAVRLDRLREPAVQRWLDGMEGSPRSIMHRRAVLRDGHTTWRMRKRLVAPQPGHRGRAARGRLGRRQPAVLRRGPPPAPGNREHAPRRPVAPRPRHRPAGGRATGPRLDAPRPRRPDGDPRGTAPADQPGLGPGAAQGRPLTRTAWRSWPRRSTPSRRTAGGKRPSGARSGRSSG